MLINNIKENMIRFKLVGRTRVLPTLREKNSIFHEKKEHFLSENTINFYQEKREFFLSGNRKRSPEAGGRHFPLACARNWKVPLEEAGSIFFSKAVPIFLAILKLDSSERPKNADILAYYSGRKEQPN